MSRALALVFLCLLQAVAFAFHFPSSTLPSSSAMLKLKMTSKTLSHSTSFPSLLRHAAADSNDDAETKKKVAREMPPPTPLSDNMRQKLLNEARSTGADYNTSNGNPILIVAVVIGVLVILGGKGFFF